MPDEPNKQALDGHYETYSFLFSDLEDSGFPPREQFDAAYSDRLEDWFSTEDGQAFEAWATNKTDQISDELLQCVRQFLKDARSQPPTDQSQPDNSEDLHRELVKAMKKLDEQVSTGPSTDARTLDQKYETYQLLFARLNRNVLPPKDKFGVEDIERIDGWLSTKDGIIFQAWSSGIRKQFTPDEASRINTLLDCIERELPVFESFLSAPSGFATFSPLLPHDAVENTDDNLPYKYSSPFVRKTSQKNKPKTTSSTSPSFKELDEKIGLASVKREIREKVAVGRVKRERVKRGLLAGENTLHMAFTGSPGTGKTSVARLVGKIYQENGLLEKGHLIELDRGKLVGQYQGKTEQITNEAIENAMDGVLFIDEAYDLAPDKGGHFDIGSLAVTIIMKAMLDHRDRLAVIAAGYTDKMSVFLDSNPGLRSRFPTVIEFPDYTPDELTLIFQKMVRDEEYVVSASAEEKVRQTIQAMHDNRDESFGNARDIEFLFRKCEKQLALRIRDVENSTDKQLTELLPEDIPDPDQLD